MSYPRKKNKLSLSCYKSRQDQTVQKICASITNVFGEKRKKGRPRKRSQDDDGNQMKKKQRKMESDVRSFELNVNSNNDAKNENETNLHNILLGGIASSAESESDWTDVDEEENDEEETSNPIDENNSDSSNKSNDDKIDSDYLEKCFKELKNEKLLRKLVKRLHDDSCLTDFMIMVRQLASGKFSPMNIVFLLCLETSKWHSLQTTTQMRFRKITKKFWTVVYRIARGIGIRLFSGPKNWGQVVAKISQKGLYNSKDSKINFAVPDERYLRKMDNKLGRIIPPGGIEDSFKIIQDKKNVVLLADCKRIAKGLGKDDLGDINLWGYEDVPNLRDRNDQLKREMDFATRLRLEHKEMDMEDKYNHGKTLLRLITNRIKDVRMYEIQESKKLDKYEKQNSDPKFKSYAKSASKTYIYILVDYLWQEHYN